MLHDRSGERYFVRALLELPVHGEDGYFGYGAGSRSASDDVAALGELWDDEEGWRSGSLRRHARERAQPLCVHRGAAGADPLREVQSLPLVELDDADHELVRAQRNGISRHRAHDLAATIA